MNAHLRTYAIQRSYKGITNSTTLIFIYLLIQENKEKVSVNTQKD